MTPEQRARKRAYDAAWHQDHREEQRVYNAAYKAAHKEEARSCNAEYRDANREEIRAQRAAYYVSNRDAILEKSARESAEFAEWLQVLRTVNGCEDCDTHEGKLEHHHVDPSTKLYNVSGMYRGSLDALEDELEKCAVLCIPCHNKRHVEMRAAA